MYCTNMKIGSPLSRACLANGFLNAVEAKPIARRQNNTLMTRPRFTAGRQGDGGLSVQETLRRLHADYRPLLVLSYLDALTVSEIARILGISVGIVKSRLCHARKQMRAILEA
jgi:DNA-directed RNA polymerase specialized sigma24 family protein